MSTYKIRFPEDEGLKYESFRYPAGEAQVRLKPSELETLSKCNRLLVTARIRDGQLMELALLSDALHHAGNFTEQNELYVPYLPYSRADRRFTTGDCFGLKVWCRALSELGYHTIRTLDVHSPVARKYLPNLTVQEAWPFIKRAYFDIGADEGVTVVLPDAGAVRYNTEGMGMDTVQATKHRDAKTGALSGFSCPKISTEAALIVDDICDGGGTFVGLADAIEGKDAAYRPTLYLYVTHGIFSKGLRPLLEKHLFEKVYTTNSIYDPDRVGGNLYFPNGRLEVFDCE